MSFISTILVSIIMIVSPFLYHTTHSLEPTEDAPPTIQLNRDGEYVELVWGPHPNTGYRIEIVDSYEQDGEWQIIYSLTTPERNEPGLLETTAFPKTTTMVPSEYQDIQLIEERDSSFYHHFPLLTVSETHSFELQFSEPFDEETISNESLFVTDHEGNVIHNFIFIYTPTQIQVRPPSDGYDHGGLYYLYVNDSIENQSDQSLSKSYKQPFYIDEDVEQRDMPPSTWLEYQEMEFDGEQPIEAEDDSDHLFSIHLSENEDGSYIILHNDEQSSSESLLPPVSIPSSFLPLHPTLPFPHQYGLTKS
ncbi:hypothetical protein [Geomicrobium sediminis]|uniref:SbsA Ig-like domain-containing protein n=1 Tax=Geomicrobium sediminis TaxID=1347788 RepID=A0ABS2PHW0_9BACL|nr:hypothetical protein [Geomicrobium sediminis]MBM7634919.1 hypothetical protein [Geomicrobium sediminis]